MRSEANKSQSVGIGLLVDQHEVRLYVAIAVIPPVTGQRMVAVSRFQKPVIG